MSIRDYIEHYDEIKDALGDHPEEDIKEMKEMAHKIRYGIEKKKEDKRMVEVIWFASKEDGAKYFRGEKSLHCRKTFDTIEEASAFAIKEAKHLRGEETIMIREVKDA